MGLRCCHGLISAFNKNIIKRLEGRGGKERRQRRMNAEQRPKIRLLGGVGCTKEAAALWTHF